MSEEILKALMELFALIVKQDGGILLNEREYVSGFLKKQLTKESVNEYLALFDEHAGPVIERSVVKNSSPPSVKDSVKILGICKKINRTLNQEQKVVVLMRLYELINAQRQFTPQRMNIINTVAEVFKILSDEFSATEQFVKNDNPEDLINPSILVLRPGDEECDLCKKMVTGYNDTKIFILRVASVDLYFIKYISNDQLYLNGLPIRSGIVYTFAPHLFLGFPTQYVERKFSAAAMQALPDPEHRQKRMKFSPRYGTALTNGLFMSSYDGLNFHRWDEIFIPAGPQRNDNWVYGDGYQTLGLLETPAEDVSAAPELTFYAGEGHWKDSPKLRRYTIRIDGFVSIHARQKPGELITKTLIFSGNALTLNFATSAAGSILVELQDESGKPFPGFSLSECDELFGDTLERIVTWNGNSDVSSLIGKQVRLRMVLSEADLYSLKSL